MVVCPLRMLIGSAGNSGVGFQLAAQLILNSTIHILLGCRSSEKGQAAVQDLQSRGSLGKVELLVIDVADEQSISAAAKKVQTSFGRLDALVNNAAIGSVHGETLSAKMIAAYRTNVVGMTLTVEAFLPLLKQSSGVARIINISSDAGSVSNVINPNMPNLGLIGVPYSASKAAMNLVTRSQARYYGGEILKVFAFTPSL